MAELHQYLVHGLRMSSPVLLPIPETDPGRVDVEFRLALTAETIPLARHTRTDDPEDPWCYEHWVGSNVIVAFPGWATFELTRTRVTLRADETDDADLVAHLLLDHILPRVVALRGDLMLHAAGVVGPSGKAHLFLGPSGTGKSTLATALAATGWPLLDDDGVRVLETDGVWLAIPGYSGVRLLPDSAEAVVPALLKGRPMAKDHPKHRYPVDGTALRMASGPVPIGCIYLVERDDDNEAPSITWMGFAASITALTKHAFHLADEPTAITRQAFEHAAAVASAVPVRVLHTSTGLGKMTATITELGELDAALS